MANLALLPVDPTRLIPIVGNLVVGIIKIADKIANKIHDVKINKRQCTTLSERINRVVGYLDSDEFKKAVNSYGDGLKQTLKSFQIFLDECYQYVLSFVDMSWIKKFIHTRSNRRLRLLFRQQAKQIDQWGKFILNKVDQLYVKNEPKLRSKSPSLMKDGSSGFGKPSVSTENSTIPLSTSSDNIFVSGIWSNRYSQNGVWYGPFKHKMNFNLISTTFQGQGENDVGHFTLSGSFSKDANRIDIIQIYKYGTGNPKLNVGHQCRFQVVWNKEKRVFEGIHYIPTDWVMMPAGQVEMSLVSAA